MRGTRLADFHRLAERLGKSCGRRRGACAGALQAARLARTTIDTIAEFLLGCANLGQEGDRIERAILIAQPLPGDMKNLLGSFPAPLSQARIEGTLVVLFRRGPEFQRVGKVCNRIAA